MIENRPNKLFINTIINSTPIKPMPLINTSCAQIHIALNAPLDSTPIVLHHCILCLSLL